MNGCAMLLFSILWMTIIETHGYMPCPREKFCSCLGNSIYCERAWVKDIPWKKFPTWVELVSLRQIFDLKHLSSELLPALPKLKKLNITSCRKLVSVGGDLPSKLPNLHLLRITQSGLTVSPAFTSPGHALRVLILNNNNLTGLDPHTSSSMPLLEHVELNHNRLASLESAWFRKGNQIAFLSANGNAIARLSPDLGSALPRLRTLRLNKNRLQSLVAPPSSRKWSRGGQAAAGGVSSAATSAASAIVLPPMPSVQRLELARNRMTSIGSLTFHDWRALRELVLRKNNLRTPETGAFYIEGGGLRELDLMGNPSIDRFDSQWAYGFDAMQRLVAARCGIRQIDTTALATMGPALRHLDLSANKLSRLQPGMWRSLRHLRVLKLAGNSLTRLPKDAFVGLTELRELSLGANSLSRLTPVTRDGTALKSVLRPLGNLTILDLSFNRLSRLSAADLQGPAAGLQRLNLNGNNLTRLEAAAFTQLSHLSHLKIDSTRLTCDCETLATSQWLASSPRLAEGVRAANCSLPAALARMPLLALTSSELVRGCEHRRNVRPVLRSTERAPPSSPRPGATRPRAQNTTVELLRGGTLRLRCRTAILPNPEESSSPEAADVAVTFHWFRILNQLKIPVRPDEPRVTIRSGRLPGGGGRWSSELRISPVGLQDGGTYRCLIDRQNPRAEADPPPLFNVSVYVAPKFTDKPPAVISTLVGANVQIPCAASGNPPPHSSLRKKGGLYFLAAKEHRITFYPGDPNFVLSNVKREDAGEYSCESVNAGGNISQPFRLVVNEIPRLKAVPKGHQVFDAGAPAVLACKAIGWPFPRITWTKNGKALRLSSSTAREALQRGQATSPPFNNERLRLGSRDQLLLFSHVTSEDAAVYSCEVRNVVGRSTARVIVDVRTPNGVYPGDPERIIRHSADNWVLSNLTGIVVIAVVSCVVLTSVVWVMGLFCLKWRLRKRQCARAASLVMAADSATGPFIERRLSPLLSSSVYITSLSDSLPGLPRCSPVDAERMAMLTERRPRGTVLVTASTFHAAGDSAPGSPTSSTAAPVTAVTAPRKETVEEAPSSGYNSGNSDYSVGCLGGSGSSEESSSGEQLSLRSLSSYAQPTRLNIRRRSDSEEEEEGEGKGLCPDPL